VPLAPRHLFDIFNLCGTLIPIVEHRGEKYGLVVYAVDNIVTSSPSKCQPDFSPAHADAPACRRPR
jgi:chemotaxis signal transduction protein